MIGFNGEEATISVPELVNRPKPSLFDIDTPKGETIFKNALMTSEGKALLLIHANKYLNDFSQSAIRPVASFSADIRKLVQKTAKVSSSKLPIIMLVEAPDIASFANTTNVEREQLLTIIHLELQGQVKQLLGELSENIFYIFTKTGSPTPLKYHLQPNPVEGPLNLFAEQLKQWGLKEAWLAGTYLKTDERDGQMRELGELPWYADNMTQSGLGDLNRYEKIINSSRLPTHHPLQKVDPDGCVPAMFRALTNIGVKAHYTQVTSPLKIPRREVFPRLKSLRKI